MTRRLKVFTWSDGFHAFTVATTSRAKALDAWGSRQDLFATGLASELSGGPDHDAALASPGEVVERGLAVDIGKIAKAAGPKKKAVPTKARRDRVKTLEARLDDLDTAHQTAMTALDKEQAEIENRRVRAERDHARNRGKLATALKAARARL